MCQPYIESATAISDIDDEEIARICRAAKINFHRLARTRNMSVDLKYDVLCL